MDNDEDEDDEEDEEDCLPINEEGLWIKGALELEEVSDDANTVIVFL